MKQDKKTLLINLGNNLRSIRLKKGYTQEELANEVGVEISQISRIERGLLNTSIYLLYEIAFVLQVEIHELLVVKDN